MVPATKHEIAPAAPSWQEGVEATDEESVAHVRERLAVHTGAPASEFEIPHWVSHGLPLAWLDGIDEPAWFVELVSALWPQLLAEADLAPSH
jgi:hypothetical protein